jgi:hypothetical protein
MITTTYECDKCGRVVSQGNEQLWYVQVRYSCNKGFSYGTPSTSKTVHWCRPCFELTGMVPTVETNPPATDKLSLDAFIREIIREETQAGS